MATKAQMNRKWAAYMKEQNAYFKKNPGKSLSRRLRAKRRKLERLAASEFNRRGRR